MEDAWKVLLCVMGVFVGLIGIILVAARQCFRRNLGWCTSKASMEGKVVVITGASAGIGKETARDLARRGARVIMACRSLQKAHNVAGEIRKDTGNPAVEVQLLDTSSMASVRNFANNFVRNEKRLDVLVLNAGIMGMKRPTLTIDGHELTMATNYLGHFLLTNILLDLLKKSSPSRIVVVSSAAHRFAKTFDVNDLNYKNRPSADNYVSYGHSKLCSILFVKQLSCYLEGTGVACNALDPGLVWTELFSRKDGVGFAKFMDIFTYLTSKTVVEGAQTTIHLAVAEEESQTRGNYFIDCKASTSSPLSNNMALAKDLWVKSEDLVQLQPKEKHY